MSSRIFRIRSADRDRETDIRRLDRLAEAAAVLHEEINRESDGLRRRYEEATRDAAFALEARETGSGQRKLDGRIDELTETVMKCEQRLRDLETQDAFYRDIRDRIAAYRTSKDL